jgi:hypothetical protein
MLRTELCSHHIVLQAHSLFQTEFFSECALVLSLSNSSTSSSSFFSVVTRGSHGLCGTTYRQCPDIYQQTITDIVRQKFVVTTLASQGYDINWKMGLTD